MPRLLAVGIFKFKTNTDYHYVGADVKLGAYILPQLHCFCGVTVTH